MSAQPFSRRLLVTVFSDASLKDGKAGFGWWFKSADKQDQGHATDGKNYGGHAELAELAGILVALKEAKTAHAGIEVDYVIQCDSLPALQALASAGCRSAKSSPVVIRPRTVRKPEEQSLRDRIRGVIGSSNVWLKHVKGHRGNACPRSSINTLTDRLSREGREGA